MANNGDRKKLFGKWNELALLFIGFLLTVVVGGLISIVIQNRTWDHQNSQTIKKEEIENAQRIFEEISSAIDSRMYLTKRLVWGYTQKKKEDEIEKRFKQYDEIIYDWNLNLNKRQSLINRYFGRDLRDIFEIEVHNSFRLISEKLDSLIRMNSDLIIAYEEIQINLEQIDQKIYGYNVTLLSRIRAGKIGKLLGKRRR